MGTKWTKGPWVVHAITNGRGVAHSVGRTAVGPEYTVAKVTYIQTKPEIVRANAHLIAAAPELYEALSHFEDMEGEKSIYMSQEWLREINAILAKARGES